MFVSRGSTILALGIVILGINIFGVTGKRVKRVDKGVVASADECKYAVAVYRDRNEQGANGWLTGGGAIVNDRYVLTAAQSVSNTETSRIAVVIGLRSIDSPDGKILPVEKIITHPAYQYGSIPKNDIALILTKDSMAMQIINGAMKLLYFPREPITNAQNFKVIAPQETLEYPNLSVHTLDQRVVSNDRCGISISKGDVDSSLQYICAENDEGTTDKQDYGSSLVSNGYIYGLVTSHTSGLPTAYTNITHYYQWIHEEMLNLYKL